MKLPDERERSNRFLNISSQPSTEDTFEARADEIVNILLSGLKESVKAEQERQQQFDAAVQRAVEGRLRAYGICSAAGTPCESSNHPVGTAETPVAATSGHNLEPSITGKQAANGEGNIPGVQTGGHAIDDSGIPDTRGILDTDAATVADERTYAEAGTPV